MTLEATINDRVYAVLARAAAKRRPCPTNQQLAALAQTNATNASYALTKLKALGKIDVEWSGERRRRVTIKVTGMMTGWSEEVCGGALRVEVRETFTDRLGEVLAKRGLRFTDVRLKPSRRLPIVARPSVNLGVRSSLEFAAG